MNEAFHRTRGMLIVPEIYVEKYKSQLKDKKVGIVRLQPERNCYISILVTVEELEKCSDVVPIPGGGSFYSFRTKLNYPVSSTLVDIGINSRVVKTIPMISSRTAESWWNIHFEDGKLKVTNDAVQGIITEVGNVDLDSISITSKELEFLNNFQPGNDSVEIKKQNENLDKGIAFNNFTYSNAAKVNLNSTYVLRSIDYSQKLYHPKFQPTLTSIKPDKKADLTIGFKIVGRESDGSLVILWKTLQAKQLKKK